MNYKIFLFILILAIMPSLSQAALEADFISRERVQFNITIPCNLDGNFCTASVVCNASLQNPDSSFILNNQLVNVTGNYIIIAVNGTTSTNRGDHIGNVICADSATGLNASTSFIYRITATGEELTTSQGIIYLLVLGVSLLAFGGILFAAFRLPWVNIRDEESRIISVNDFKYLKVFCWWMAFMFLIWINWLMYNISFAYLNFNVASNIFKVLNTFFLGMILPVFVFFVMVFFIKFVEDQKLIKDIERGIARYD